MTYSPFPFWGIPHERSVSWKLNPRTDQTCSIPEALRAANISQQMKSLLRFLQTVQGTVPCTDAARRVMRGKISFLTTYFGNPLLFVTLNPADVLHPFTWRHSLDAPALPLPTATLDQYLVSALGDHRLWRIVAQDPTAAVEAFHIHIDAFLKHLLDIPYSEADLPPDGGVYCTTQKCGFQHKRKCYAHGKNMAVCLGKS